MHNAVLDIYMLEHNNPQKLYLLDKGGYFYGSIGLSVCLFVCLWTLLKKLSTDWSEILWRAPG